MRQKKNEMSPAMLILRQRHAFCSNSSTFLPSTFFSVLLADIFSSYTERH
jgi:hypothetical protein